MKGKFHAIFGVLSFLCIVTFIVSTGVSGLFGSHESIARVKGSIFIGVFFLIPSLAAIGASGMSLLGKRQEALGLTKQKRGPIAFMTSLFVLLPSSYFLSRWASANTFDVWYYSVQGVELVASGVCFVMIGLNIRDGYALTGRIRAGRGKAPVIEERDGGPLVAGAIPVLIGPDGTEHKLKPTMALCRCGASKNKPYCDGSHADIGWKDANG